MQNKSDQFFIYMVRLNCYGSITKQFRVQDDVIKTPVVGVKSLSFRARRCQSLKISQTPYACQTPKVGRTLAGISHWTPNLSLMIQTCVPDKLLNFYVPLLSLVVLCLNDFIAQVRWDPEISYILYFVCGAPPMTSGHNGRV